MNNAIIFAKLIMGKSRQILGLMSGSSLDGLDMALCRFQESAGELKWEMLEGRTVSFTDEIAEGLIAAEELSTRQLFELEAAFSVFCAEASIAFAQDLDERVHAIASHGHTVFHEPAKGFSLQLGNGGTISVLTGLPVICDFRIGDIALGGEGAPLVPIAEKICFPGHDYYLNLGGIANLSDHTSELIKSFDVCPCNQVLNYLANQAGKEYDDKGEMASRGKIIKSVQKRWNALAYFKRPFPKSLDNSWVKRHFIESITLDKYSIEDYLHTMVDFIVQQLVSSISDWLKPAIYGTKSLLVTGGGAHNDFLIEGLARELQIMNINVEKPQESIIDYKEAILIGLMGYMRLCRLPNILSSVTGASRDSVGGAVYRA